MARVGILTVSDTASAEASADKSGPAIKGIVTKHGFQVQDEHCRIVADDAERVAHVVGEWCRSGSLDWVITTGGTGFGVRDVTPEAITPLIERPAPGLVHLMISSSLKHTPLAALSRPVAGTIKNTLITTLPGSVKAVKENLEALLQAGVVEHAIELIRGGSGQQVHHKLKLLTSDTSGQLHEASSIGHNHEHHHHHHHHHHGEHQAPTPRSKKALSHDPSAPVSVRHRKSQFPQVSLESALEAIKKNIQRLPVQTLPVTYKLGGHVLAEDVYAPQDVPPTATTSVDGYALRSTDSPGIYTVVTSQTHPLHSPLPSGSIYRINTGGPLPVGTDSVIMVEDTELISTFDGGQGITDEEKEVEILVQVPPADNVRAPGSDVRKGELVMKAGDRVSRGGGEVGTLAFVGRKEVNVYKKPVVALMSTGDEIVDLHQAQSRSSDDVWGGIYDTNRPSLQAVLESSGYEVLDLGIIPDDITAHLDAIKKGLQSADLLLTTGGTSMGPTDLLKPLIERYLDGVIHFGRVSVKPGKPTTFAQVPVIQGDQTIWKPVFALPGNPASALVTFYVFVVPALRKMGGWPDRSMELPKVAVQIQNAMPLDPRTEFHRAVIRSTVNYSLDPSTRSEGGVAPLKAYGTGSQRSSRAASLCEANCLVVLPPLAPVVAGQTRKVRLEAGEFAEALVIGEIEMVV